MNKLPSIHVFMTKHIDKQKARGISQRQIAQICGFASPNMISILKKGVTPVPLTKIRVISQALDVNPKELLLVVLKEQNSELYQMLHEHMFEHILTKEEVTVAKEAVQKFRAEQTSAKYSSIRRHATQSKDGFNQDVLLSIKQPSPQYCSPEVQCAVIKDSEKADIGMDFNTMRQNEDFLRKLMDVSFITQVRLKEAMVSHWCDGDTMAISASRYGVYDSDIARQVKKLNELSEKIERVMKVTNYRFPTEIDVGSVKRESHLRSLLTLTKSANPKTADAMVAAIVDSNNINEASRNHGVSRQTIMKKMKTLRVLVEQLRALAPFYKQAAT